MKSRYKIIVPSVLLLNIVLCMILLKYMLNLSWTELYQFVTELFETNGYSELEYTSSGVNLLLLYLTLAWSAFELGIFAIILLFIYQRLNHRIFYLEKSITNFIDTYSIRKIVSFTFLSVILISLVLIRTLEGISWLDSIYFIIITISTVGYGDTVVTHPFTKVITIVLIVNGLTFIALASQLLINNIVNLQLRKQNPIPDAPLNLKSHVVIAGFGSKGRRLAQLFSERGYYVLVIEQNEERGNLARVNGYQVINGDITKPALLELLSLQHSAGLFLLLSDDNMVIQTGILARSIAPDLDIYGEFLSVPTYEIAKYAGINKPILLSVFLTNALQDFFYLDDIKIASNFVNTKSRESKLTFVEVPNDFDHEYHFNNPLYIGDLSRGYNELFVYQNNVQLPKNNYNRESSHKLFALHETDPYLKERSAKRQEIELGRMVFAGYNPLVDALIERLDFPQERIIVLWQIDDDAEKLSQKNIKIHQWSLENGHQLLEQIIKQRDVVICSFEDITSSLIVGVTLNNLRSEDMKDIPPSLHPKLIQLVPYEYDIEPLMKVGAEIVFTPQQIISSAMLTLFLNKNNIAPSVVFTNGHLYEHKISLETSEYLREIESIFEIKSLILYYKSENSLIFKVPDKDYVIQPGDRLIIFVLNDQKERLDRLDQRY